MKTNAKIGVCSLDLMERYVVETSASHLVSLINEQMMPQTPETLKSEHHLKLSMNDVVEPVSGCVLPSHLHVEQFIDFVRSWEGEQPMIIHCWAGVSRSTAAAFIALCILNPKLDEDRVAQHLRQKSPTATPNQLLVANADQLLDRNGRMIKAIETIGRGEMTSLGTPFITRARLEGEEL